MYHPSRGGVRGGRDQFNWEDVKADKHRENYLGHSVKAPVGRWQKGKDLYWYTKDHGSEGSTKEEIKRIQEEEEDAMKEMLGLAPRKNKRPQGNQLDKREVDELLKKGKGGEELAPAYVDGERVQGLGFAPAPGQIGGQAGGKRSVELKPNDNVSLPPQQMSSVEKEVEKDVTQRTLPPSEGVATSPRRKSREESGESSAEETGSRKKRKDEKRKAKELRRDAKRSRREARKVLKDDSGHRYKDRKMDSSGYGRHEDKGRARQERKSTSPDYQCQRGKEGYGKARNEDNNDSNNNGEKARRLSTGHNNRRKDDHCSSSDGEPFRSRTQGRRSESPYHRGQTISRQDADGERKVENSSSDDSAFVKRHKRDRR